MAITPISKPDIGRGKTLSAVLLTLAMLAAFVSFAPFASAHHAEVSAIRDCPVDGFYTVTYTAKSWNQGSSAPELKDTGSTSTSGHVEVRYKIDSGSWVSLPNGEFTSANGRQFTGTFTVPAGSNATVAVRDQGHWTNGVAASGTWNKTYITPKSGCTQTVTPTTPGISRTGECEAWDHIQVPEDTDQIDYETTTSEGAFTVTATAKSGFVFPSVVPPEMASQGWVKLSVTSWRIIMKLGQNPPCVETWQVIPAKYWDFGEIPEAQRPADGSATVTITAHDGEETFTKSWTFDTSGNFIGDDTPLVLPLTEGLGPIDVTETLINPHGWSCVRVKLETFEESVDEFPVWNRCTRIPDETIPPSTSSSTVPPTSSTTVPPTTVSSTTSTTEEVGGIEETSTTSTTEEVLDTVVTPTITPPRRLPRTGSNSTTTLSLAGVFLTAGAAFVLFGRRRFHSGN